MSASSSSNKAFNPYREWLGIPEQYLPPTHYRLLGLENFESNPASIANAADRAMMFVRTFQTGKHSDESQQLLNELSAARVCLLNADTKAEYDAQLRKTVRDNNSGGLVSPPMPVKPVAVVKPVPPAQAVVAVKAVETPVVPVAPLFSVETGFSEPGVTGIIPQPAAKTRRPAKKAAPVPWQVWAAVGAVLLAVPLCLLLVHNRTASARQHAVELYKNAVACCDEGDFDASREAIRQALKLHDLPRYARFADSLPEQEEALRQARKHYEAAKHSRDTGDLPAAKDAIESALSTLPESMRTLRSEMTDLEMRINAGVSKMQVAQKKEEDREIEREWQFLHHADILRGVSELVPEESVWSYTNDDPGDNWATAYPLPGRKSGMTPFSTDGAWPLQKKCIWMTCELTLPADYTPGNLHIRYECDNFMWLYINGTLVYRANTHLDWTIIRNINNLLRPGRNIIAVRCENEGDTESNSGGNPAKIAVGLYTDSLPVPDKVTCDGNVLASASFDGTIKTWDVGTGKLLNTFVGHTDKIQGIVFSPDGKKLYSVSDDQTVRVWDSASGGLLKTIEAYDRGVRSLAISRNGKLLYSASNTDTMKIWDTETWKCREWVDESFKQNGGYQGLGFMVVSPGGAMLATALTFDVGIYCTKTGNRETRYTNYYAGQTHRIAFSSDSQIVGHTQSNVTNFHTVRGKHLFGIHEAHNCYDMHQIATIPSSPNFFIGARDGELLVVNWHTQEVERLKTGHEKEGIWAIAVSPDGSKLSTAGADKTIEIRHAQTGELLHTLRGHGDTIRSLAFSPY